MAFDGIRPERWADVLTPVEGLNARVIYEQMRVMRDERAWKDECEKNPFNKIGPPVHDKENILKLADHMEKNVAQNDFSMASWCHCIAGQCYRMLNPDKVVHSGMGAEVVETARRFMGLSGDVALRLFSAGEDINTPQKAATVLRHLADTGQVHRRSW